MTYRAEPKWRPTLGMITTGLIIAVLALPLLGLVFFRLYENQLVRQTEGELIAQSAVLAAVMADTVAAAPPGTMPRGISRPQANESLSGGRFTPIEPVLDLSRTKRLPRRPPPVAAEEPLGADALALGASLEGIVAETQRVTLAGFVLLDAKGRIIQAYDGVGLSLSHVEEVREAMKGRFVSVLRKRPVGQPAPPLSSLSRSNNLRVFTALPVFHDGRLVGIIHASRTPENILRHLYGERGKVALAALFIFFIALIVGIAFVRLVTGPLHRLVEQTRQIGKGDRDAIKPLEHYGTRELALLTDGFMTMAERLFDRSDYLNTFAAHVSHELKTPLSSIRGAAEVLADDDGTMDPATRERFLGNIEADAKRMAVLLERLRDLARADNPELGGTVRFGAIVEALAAAHPALAVESRVDPALRLGLSSDNAAIVFSHLADNAVRHGATRLLLEPATGAPEGTVSITVRDNGQGIAPGNLEQIFEPFFTTRREDGGTGMGLQIVRAMLQAHEGRIES
ncbi:MAG: ATP-binding protein, partial [Pseudomonadota bacterium]